MSKIRLFTGEMINEKYFTNTLNELLQESWQKKKIEELQSHHVLCLLSFETISEKSTSHFYESDKGNIISNEAYENYIRK